VRLSRPKSLENGANEEDHFDLFALSMEKNNHENTISNDLYVDKIFINGNKYVDQSSHFLVSDRDLQKDGYLRFIYENEKSEDANKFNEIAAKLHSISTEKLESTKEASIFMNSEVSAQRINNSPTLIETKPSQTVLEGGKDRVTKKVEKPEINQGTS
jgi:hypothetical protein